VTLWAANAGAPRQLGQTRAGADGRFALSTAGAPGKDATLYLVAKGGRPTVNKASGDNPAIALMTVVGNRPPARVTINEFTTVASVWTHAQFLDGTAIKGHALGLRIAAGNVPNFVDLATGGWGSTIQDALNSSQTPTMANFATLADVLSGCVTRVSTDACTKVFAAATPPNGVAPTDTLTAAQSIDRAYPWYTARETLRPARPVLSRPAGQDHARGAVHAVPQVLAERAWVLPLKVTGGGFRAGGKRCSTARATSGSATTSR
jgi:hypothetical protein